MYSIQCYFKIIAGFDGVFRDGVWVAGVYERVVPADGRRALRLRHEAARRRLEACGGGVHTYKQI